MLKFINSSYRLFYHTSELSLLSDICSVSVVHITTKAKYSCSNVNKSKSHQPNVYCCNFSMSYNNKITVSSMGDYEKPESKFASHGGVYKISMIDGEEEETSSQTSFCTSKQTEPIIVPPDFRVWETVSSEPKNEDDDNAVKFKVLSYNVLAQYLLNCHPYLYTECLSHCLKWQYRANLLYNEITHLSPDIICLQEVQSIHIPTFYSKFEQLGYFGIFKQKTGFHQDGCAIYFKESKFDMIEYITVEYYQPNMPILNRDNIGLVVKLTSKQFPEHPFIVATTHLLFNPRRTDVRLSQMQVLLAEIDRFSIQITSDGVGKRLPVILTGDFNSTPDNEVIKLLSKGKVCKVELNEPSDWRTIAVTDQCQHLNVFLNRQNNHYDASRKGLKIQNTDYEEEQTALIEETINKNESLFNSNMLSHNFNLKSVYDYYKTDGQTEATTFQNFWVTVDYIYFSNNSGLKLLERLRLPTAKECEVLQHLPNETYGSDHLCLGAIFEFKPIVSKL